MRAFGPKRVAHVSRVLILKYCVAAALISGCGSYDLDVNDAGFDQELFRPEPVSDGGVPCRTPSQCAALWEERAAARYQASLNTPSELAAFLRAVPKGGDLHNHLTGAVYAESYLGWAKTDGSCINRSTLDAVYSNQCSASTEPVPDSGTFYDQLVRAWSMQNFNPGIETGHDHFFAAFGKFGAVAGAHRDDAIADVVKRAADENQLYVELMFNLGKNVGTLAAAVWPGAVNAANLSRFYDALVADPHFAAQLESDVDVVTDAAARYKGILGCSLPNPPAACQVGVRFIAQVSRTGALNQIFGQLVSAYEIAARTQVLVGANLSSPEDNAISLKNYDLHMAMLDFLHKKYKTTGKSPLHISLHAGELVPKHLPAGYGDANTFHIRHAVEIGHAERIGHGVDVLSESDSTELMAQMRERNVLVEVCLSSNDQILEVSGNAHPLGQYLQHGVPVALATDDQGVSRSSLAGEYARAAREQRLSYRQLKRLARNSLEHAFLPGASLWASLAEGRPVAACAPTETMGVGDPPNAGCQEFLSGSERAQIQWELERRFLAFESGQ